MLFYKLFNLVCGLDEQFYLKIRNVKKGPKSEHAIIDVMQGMVKNTAISASNRT
jgi:hypothetical protein